MGVPHGQALIQLLSDIEAFENAHELLRYLGQDATVLPERETFVVSIGEDYTATFVAVGVKMNRDTHCRIIWSSVRRLKLAELRRVHDGQ